MIVNEKTITLSELEESQIIKTMEQSYLCATNLFELITIKQILNKLGVQIQDCFTLKRENHEQEENEIEEKGNTEQGSIFNEILWEQKTKEKTISRDNIN